MFDWLPLLQHSIFFISLTLLLISENIQKWHFDFYASMSIIFVKPLEFSLRIMYNIQCTQLTNIIIYHQNQQIVIFEYLNHVPHKVSEDGTFPTISSEKE